MTTKLIAILESTSVANANAYNLTGAGSALIVSATGGLLALGSGKGDGILSSGNSQSVTLDGLAYGNDDGIQCRACTSKVPQYRSHVSTIY